MTELIVKAKRLNSWAYGNNVRRKYGIQSRATKKMKIDDNDVSKSERNYQAKRLMAM